MVNVELTDVDWDEGAVFTVVLLVDRVRVLALDDVASVDGVASISTGKGRHSAIAEFDFSRTTD